MKIIQGNRHVDEAIEFFSQNQNGDLRDIWFRFSALRKGECGRHAYHVARISYLIGRKMGMTQSELRRLFISALLHDVGKLAISENVLLKPGPLNEDEYRYIQKHVWASSYILSQISVFKFSEIIQNILFHHEAVNGSGYPFGLCGSQIPIGARIIAASDVYDAVSANRSYNNGGSHDMAWHVLKEGQGRKFDLRVIECLFSLPIEKMAQA